jgi:hypothetical protein
MRRDWSEHRLVTSSFDLSIDDAVFYHLAYDSITTLAFWISQFFNVGSAESESEHLSPRSIESIGPCEIIHTLPWQGAH